MDGTSPQVAAAKLGGASRCRWTAFVAGPDHSMDWMTGSSVLPGLIGEHVQTTGAILAGRNDFDSAIGDARPAEDVTVLSCPVDEAVRIALHAWLCR